MQELTGEGLCSAHQGLSLVVTARLGAQERTILFDAGPDPYALERNVRRMEQLSVQPWRINLNRFPQKYRKYRECTKGCVRVSINTFSIESR
jgi:hypothetical protein